MRLSRPLTVLSVSFVVAASAAGCGSIVVDPSAATSDGSAAGTNTSAKSSAGELTPENLPQRVLDAQTDQGTCHLVMTVEAAGTSTSIESDIVVHDDTQDLHMVMQDPSSGGTIDMIFVDGDTYIGLGEASQGKFVAVDPDDGSTLGDLAAGLEGQSDPSSTVEALDGAITSVKAVGQEKIDGTTTTDYEVVVDTSKMSGAAAEQMQAAGGAMPDELTYHYLLDDDDLLRKVTIEIAGATSTMEYSKYGEDVTVEAPSKDDLVDASTLGL